MKRLLVGLLMLGSISCFAVEYQNKFPSHFIKVEREEGNSFKIIESEANADMFCLSKGFSSAVSYKGGISKIGNFAYHIMPSGDIGTGITISKDGTRVLKEVVCTIEVQK
jgi:hypothetical protein